MRLPFTVFALLVLASCASPSAMPGIEARVEALGRADVLLLGEQHDAPDHQRIHRETIEALARRDALAAVALEMAPAGGTTRGLPRDAGEPEVRAALRWDDAAWPWPAYAPAVMAGVRAGVPVVGGNLPRAAMRAAMADEQLDAALPGPALKAQQQAIRAGHCDLLPESQITPMTRIQIARDRSIAQAVAGLAAPGRSVVLLAGAGHVDRSVGVPLHLPPGLTVRAVALRAGAGPESESRAAPFDAVWVTPPIPPKDYCAEFRRGMARP